jgi:parallel beta-helix repeat protein
MDDFFIDSSNNNIIRYNDVSDSDRGVHLVDSRNNTIRDNAFVNAGISIQSNVLDHWNSHTIDTTNTVNGKPVRYWKNIVGGTIQLGAGQVILANCTGVVVENQNVSDGSVGIQLGFSSNNTIARNVADGNTLGIQFSSSHSNVIDNNALANNDFGFSFKLSNDNLVTNESVSNSSDSAFSIVDSQRNLIRDNVLSDNDIGINLASSVYITIENTTIIRSGIFVAGDMLDYWNTHRIDTSNTVNGKPVYYWKNVTGGTVPLGAGQVILANCTGVNITGQELSDATRGVTLGYSSYNTISDLVAHYNSRNGIFLYRSANNNITNSIISHAAVQGIQFSYSSSNNINGTVSLDNRYGLYMYGSDQNVFLNNTFSLNAQQGAYMSNSDSNTLSGNTFQANQEIGLCVRGSSGNLIFHNNFLNNSNQSFDNVANSWDNGYPSGGNYWGDYNGTDTKNGINQDLPGSDGIGDIPFNITGGPNQDRYPLMNPLVVLPIVPSEPLGLSANPGDGYVNVTWGLPSSDGGSAISSYRIYRGSSPGGETHLTTIGTSSYYNDTDVTNGQIYYYEVAAVNAVGEGPKSNEANAMPADIPGAPTGLVPLPSNSKITLMWSPPNDTGGLPILSYAIYRGTTSGGEIFLAEVDNVLNYTDTGLTNGVLYFYTVSAMNSIGEGPQSNEVNATPSNILPTCTITDPISGFTVTGLFQISGSAYDSDGPVLTVEVRIDNGSWHEAVGNMSWTYDWDTASVPDGQHMIYARSYDGMDYSADVSVTVTVDNPDSREPGQDWLWVAVAAIIIIAVVVLLALLILRRKNREPEERDTPEKPVEEDSET